MTKTKEINKKQACKDCLFEIALIQKFNKLLAVICLYNSNKRFNEILKEIKKE